MKWHDGLDICKALDTRLFVRMKDASVKMDLMKLVMVTELDKTASDAYLLTCLLTRLPTRLLACSLACLLAYLLTSLLHGAESFLSN